MSGPTCTICDWRVLPLAEAYPGDGKCPRCGEPVAEAMSIIDLCPACDGTGKVWREGYGDWDKCPECDGGGGTEGPPS